MLLQGWPKALLLKDMIPVGVTKLPFQCLGQKVEPRILASGC